MSDLDPRLTPARRDLAAQHLAGRVAAARFVVGDLYQVIAAQAPVRRLPRADAPLDTEALMGERVTVYEIGDEGWAWGQLEGDGYVGYLPTEMLDRPGAAATHKVAALRTLVFPGPSIKLAPVAAPSLGARLAIVGRSDRLAVTAQGGYVPESHLALLDRAEDDVVAVAERFLGTPYLWGGKTSLGLDCSGLVQTALQACGRSCPRDSDMQERTLGLPLASPDELRRGDLVFWKGHVALVRDRNTLIHANAFHMAVAIEPVAEALARIRAAGSKVTSLRRIAPPA